MALVGAARGCACEHAARLACNKKLAILRKYGDWGAKTGLVVGIVRTGAWRRKERAVFDVASSKADHGGNTSCENINSSNSA